jgi:hypothetical protein
MRQRWICFVNGDGPWSANLRFAYGPLGECKAIDESQFAGRRRVGHCNALKEAGNDTFIPIVISLTAGRISLLN